MSVKVLEDGTRLYSNGTRYTPVPVEQRKNFSRRPASPDATLWQGKWFVPLPLVEERVMPETRPDSIAFDHAYRVKCRCPVCRRPQARLWRLKYRRQMRRGAGLQVS